LTASGLKAEFWSVSDFGYRPDILYLKTDAASGLKTVIDSILRA
jgi:hypothetical protein